MILIDVYDDTLTHAVLLWQLLAERTPEQSISHRGMPTAERHAAFVRSHFDGMEVQINDAPRANEIVVAVAITDSGRPLPRIGGLQVHEIKGEDGLR